MKKWEIICKVLYSALAANPIVLFLIIIALCSCKQKAASELKPHTVTSHFQVGQVWSFHASTNYQTSSNLTVVRVDFNSKNYPIVYVSIPVMGMHYKTAGSPMFMPFSEEALNRSIVTLISTNGFLVKHDLEDFEKFYVWHNSGIKSGDLDECFNLTVAEALDTSGK